MNFQDQENQIKQFESHYQYDASYARDMLHTSTQAYEKFGAFKPMSMHREKLSVEEYWVAKLAAVQSEDCGSCMQLNVRMALEAGLEKKIVKAILASGKELPARLKKLYQFARKISQNAIVNTDLRDEIVAMYSKGELLEIGLCIAAARVFSTIKRAAGYSKSCSLVSIAL